MPSSPNKGYTLPTFNSEIGSWGTDVNVNLTGIIDLNLGGQVGVSLSSTNVTLTTTATGQMQNLIVTLTGTLLTNVTVSSAAVGFYLVENRTTGAFTVTWAANFGGGTVGTAWVIPQGYSGLFFSDTTYGARCLNWMPLILAAASGATPAILRRTENDTVARKALSIQSGLGSGNDYAIYETGDAASGVATITEQIGATVIATKTATAYGLPLPLSLTEVATPTAPAAGIMQFYAYSGDLLASQTPGGVQRVYGKDPTVQRFTTGSGTYTPTTGTVRIRVRMIGGGGAGSGSAGSGSSGSSTSLGTWTVNGGSGGTGQGGTGGPGGTGGANGTGILIVRCQGIPGGGSLGTNVNAQLTGGNGGSGPFGGGGIGGATGSGAGTTAAANSGAGGGGQGGNQGVSSYPGGGSGEYVEFYVSAPGPLSYVVGAGGTVAGSGLGAAGSIIIEEFYN
jgi:hypothetical protein